MKEIVSVNLDNEMDIILAHKRAMKLAELCGCSLVTQTTVATAVSEIARVAVEFGRNSRLTFFIESTGGKKNYICQVKSAVDFGDKVKDAITYAKRLVTDVKIVSAGKDALITLRYALNFAGLFTDNKIRSFVDYFDKEPPLSAYDELRRKNQQLQDMAEKIKETETEYKILSDTLPLMMFSTNSRGLVTFSNRWLQDFFGSPPKELAPMSWQTVVHANDFSTFSKELNAALLKQVSLTGQYRLKNKNTGSYLWHMISFLPLKNDKEIITGWIGFLVDINAQKVVEQTLKDNKELKDTQQQLFAYQEELERKVVELNRSNYELEQFAHLASHDLQEPLRKLFFYSDMLRRKYSTAIDDSGVTILKNMTHAAARMRELIQDLLSYSQLHKQKLTLEPVNLQDVMNEILRDLEVNIKEKDARITVREMPVIQGHQLRLQQLFLNLLSNSLKYARKDVRPEVEVLSERTGDKVVVRVADNGIGFDPQFSEKIFGLFERLHSRDEFPGTGIGLSICKKIAELHGGTITATSKPNEYSIFEVHFPLKQNLSATVEI
jgi:PAS domain S-box-containing protein